MQAMERKKSDAAIEQDAEELEKDVKGQGVYAEEVENTN